MLFGCGAQPLRQLFLGHSCRHSLFFQPSKGARDVDELLAENTALFAGGKLSQEQKDAFFNAIMTAYVTCKEEAKAKFGHKDS